MLFFSFISLASAATILDAISAPQYSTLVSLASKLPAVLTVLNGTGPLTLFAPTNDAFSALQAADPNTFTAVTSNDTLLASVLTYHVLAGVAFDPASAKPAQSVQTANGADLFVSVAKTGVTLKFGLGSASVTGSANGTNGIVHTVDHVLVPPTDASATAVAGGLTRLVAALTNASLVSTVDSLANITIFAPNDAAFTALDEFLITNNLTLTPAILSAVLSLHIVKGVYYSFDLPASGSVAVTSADLGTPINVTASTVNGAGNVAPAKILTTDVLVAQGVVHVIDTVLLPDLTTIHGLVVPSFTNGTTPNTPSGAVTSSSASLMGVVALVSFLLF